MRACDDCGGRTEQPYEGLGAPLAAIFAVVLSDLSPVRASPEGPAGWLPGLLELRITISRSKQVSTIKQLVGRSARMRRRGRAPGLRQEARRRESVPGRDRTSLDCRKKVGHRAHMSHTGSTVRLRAHVTRKGEGSRNACGDGRRDRYREAYNTPPGASRGNASDRSIARVR